MGRKLSQKLGPGCRGIVSQLQINLTFITCIMHTYHIYISLYIKYVYILSTEVGKQSSELLMTLAWWRAVWYFTPRKNTRLQWRAVWYLTSRNNRLQWKLVWYLTSHNNRLHEEWRFTLHHKTLDCKEGLCDTWSHRTVECNDGRCATLHHRTIDCNEGWSDTWGGVRFAIGSSLPLLNLWLQIAVEWPHECCHVVLPCV